MLFLHFFHIFFLFFFFFFFRLFKFQSSELCSCASSHDIYIRTCFFDKMNKKKCLEELSWLLCLIFKDASLRWNVLEFEIRNPLGMMNSFRVVINRSILGKNLILGTFSMVYKSFWHYHFCAFECKKNMNGNFFWVSLIIQKAKGESTLFIHIYIFWRGENDFLTLWKVSIMSFISGFDCVCRWAFQPSQMAR